MGFNRENYRRIKREYETKNLKAKEKARDRANELHVRFPEIRDIDDALEKTGMKILEASLNFSGNKLDECIAGLNRKQKTCGMPETPVLNSIISQLTTPT